MLLQYLLAFFITSIVIYLLRPLAIKLDLIDVPGGRKQHSKNTPLIGGVAMFAGLVFSLLVSPYSLHNFRALLLASGIIVFVGVLDDFHEVSARAKLFSQIIAGLIITLWSKVVVHSLGNLFFLGSIKLGVFAVPFSIVAVVGVVNAVNMVDGIDGLSGGLALVQAVLLLLVGMHLHAWLAVKFIALFIAALLAFLCFNFPIPGRRQALIFMGDAGSMLIGLVLAYFAISFSQFHHHIAAPVTFLWILSLPLFDMGYVMLRRFLKRVSVMRADRWHLHHVLLDSGCSARVISISMPAANLLIGGLGLWLSWHHVSEGLMFCFILLLFFIYSLLLHIGSKHFVKPDNNHGTTE